jgi:hypothetical protein
MKHLSKFDRIRAELATAESKLLANPHRDSFIREVQTLTRQLREAEAEALEKHLEAKNAEKTP